MLSNSLCNPFLTLLGTKRQGSASFTHSRKEDSRHCGWSGCWQCFQVWSITVLFEYQQKCLIFLILALKLSKFVFFIKIHNFQFSKFIFSIFFHNSHFSKFTFVRIHIYQNSRFSKLTEFTFIKIQGSHFSSFSEVFLAMRHFTRSSLRKIVEKSVIFPAHLGLKMKMDKKKDTCTTNLVKPLPFPNSIWVWIRFRLNAIGPLRGWFMVWIIGVERLE